jgi:hypothetical protein
MNLEKPKLLVACEYSGRVRDAFALRGWDAWSCDLLPSETPGQHYQGDVRDMIGWGWDLMICHPPCTYMTNSGVCWLHKQPERWAKLKEATEFFKMFLSSDVPRIAIENPIMHKYAKDQIGQNQTQVIQPWMFGHAESKATCLWLKGLPNLISTNDVKTEMMNLPARERQRLHFLPPSKDRWKLRSRTFSGIAQAMAEQWGPLVEMERMKLAA